MKKFITCVVVSCLLLVCSPICESVPTTTDTVMDIGQGVTAVLASTMIVADRSKLDDEDSIKGRLCKTMLDATRLANGICVLYNQHAYNKNLQMHKYTASWIVVDALRLIMDVLPKKALESLGKLVPNVSNEKLLSKSEEKLYEWINTSGFVEKLRDYVLPSVEIGTTLWTSYDSEDDSEEGQTRKLRLAGAKGVVRSLQSFCDAKTVALKRFYSLVLLIHLAALGWDFAFEPAFSLSGDNCSICFDDLVVGRSSTTGCNHPFHDRCLQRWLSDHSNCPLCRARLNRVTLEVESVGNEDVWSEFMRRFS